MPVSKLISLALHTAAATAKPDEYHSMLEEAVKDGHIVDAKSAGVRDSEPEKKDKDDDDDDKDKAAKDAAAEEKAVADAEKEMDKAVADAVKDADKKEDDEKGAKDDEPEIIVPIDERVDSDFSLTEAAKDMDTIRKVVARSKDQGAKDAYVRLATGIKRAQKGVKDGAMADPFKALTKPTAFEGVADADTDEELPAHVFFNGKSYRDGLAAHNEYLQSRYERRHQR